MKITTKEFTQPLEQYIRGLICGEDWQVRDLVGRCESSQLTAPRLVKMLENRTDPDATFS